MLAVLICVVILQLSSVSWDDGEGAPPCVHPYLCSQQSTQREEEPRSKEEPDREEREDSSGTTSERTAVPGCPPGAYMSDDYRQRAHAALLDHFAALESSGYVPQTFRDEDRGILSQDGPDEQRFYEFTSGFDAKTSETGFSHYESPEWPKPPDCKSFWGPTNAKTDTFQGRKDGGRSDMVRYCICLSTRWRRRGHMYMRLNLKVSRLGDETELT